MFERRPTSHFRSRSSVAVVLEARGLPLKVLSLMLSAGYILVGLNQLFRCSKPLTWNEQEAHLMEFFADCDTHYLPHVWAMIIGSQTAMQGILRFYMATVVNVGDLYTILAKLVLVDWLSVLLALRLGLANVNPVYFALSISAVVYETYAFSIAQQAHLARLKEKNKAQLMKSLVAVQETRGTGFTILSHFLSILFACVFVRDYFFCEFRFSEGERIPHGVFDNCYENPVRAYWAGVEGIYVALHAVMRYEISMATRTKDLYFALVYVTLVEAVYFYACHRVVYEAGFETAAWMYFVMLYTFPVAQFRVLGKARKGYLERLREKEEAATGEKDE